MALIRAHRQVVYRLLPRTRASWRWLETTLETQRQLYNAALEERMDCYRKTGKSRTCFDQCRALTECRRELPEMAECGIAIQRGTLKRLDESFKGFFNRLKTGAKAGFPKFRGRRFFDSITIVSGVKVRDGTLHIPGFGPMTIRRKGGNPHVGFLIDSLRNSRIVSCGLGRFFPRSSDIAGHRNRFQVRAAGMARCPAAWMLHGDDFRVFGKSLKAGGA